MENFIKFRYTFKLRVLEDSDDVYVLEAHDLKGGPGYHVAFTLGKDSPVEGFIDCINMGLGEIFAHIERDGNCECVDVEKQFKGEGVAPILIYPVSS